MLLSPHRSRGLDSVTTLVVLQPGYLPWLGYFDLMRRADVFVHYDDVQFDKHGWRNRNRVKGPKGGVWLTVPVRHSGRSGQPIRDVEIDHRQDWERKHVATISQLYARAPFLLARLLREGGGVPAHGNQRKLWDAGCRPGFENPDYR
jgi:hypothetical protein